MKKQKHSNDKSKWIILVVVCLGVLMTVLDTTIVNVALPSIKEGLGFSTTSLVWVVNAYMLTFAGFLLLGGRLGDIFGHKRIFLLGIALFSISSLACGLAYSKGLLISARAIQGIGGAIMSAVALSLIMNTFTSPGERAKAMGVFGFVAAGGGSIGVLLGGVLTSAFDWHWIFLVNLPIGLIVSALCIILLKHNKNNSISKTIDFYGAITITSSLMLAVYAIVSGNEIGWLSMQTLEIIFIAIILFSLFIFIESRIKDPLMPLDMFKLRNVAVANIVGVLWAGGMFAWFFISALYMQAVLEFTPLQVGLSFLPANIIMAMFSVGLSAKIVMRFGIKRPLSIGLFVASLGLLLFAFSPQDGNFLMNILPNMILLGIGAGMAFNPLLLSAMNDVKKSDSGIASGMVNTSFMMGGALGLAILASIAAIVTTKIVSSGDGQIAALVEGYHYAFFTGALIALIASLISALFLKDNFLRKKHINQ